MPAVKTPFTGFSREAIPNSPGDLRGRFPSQPNPYRIPASPAPPSRPYVPLRGGSPSLNPFVRAPTPKPPAYAVAGGRNAINNAYNNTIGRVRVNTVNAPVGRTLDQINRITPKANVPLINKINERMARGLAAPAARAAAPQAAGWFARARGVFGRAAPFVNKAVGIYGWLTLAADAMEAARPYVWAYLGIKDPNAVESPDSWGQAGTVYKVDWNATVSEDGIDVFTGGVSYELEGPITGLKSRPGNPYTSWYIGYGQGQEAGAGYTKPNASLRTNFLRITPIRSTAGNPIPDGMTIDTSVPAAPTASPPKADPKNPQRSPAGKAGPNPKALPSSQPQRSPAGKTQTRPQSPTTVAPAPYPAPNPDPPTPREPPEVKPGECDPCEALDWIVEQMKQQPKTPRTYQLRVPYVVCTESGNGENATKEGRIEYFYFDVLQEPRGWLDAFTRSAEQGLKGCECNGEAVAAIPDWWQVRLGADRPQVCVIYRVAGKRTYHTLSIPHPKTLAKPDAPPLPAYQKGSWQGQITLLDNSKFTVNAASQGEAQRVINAAMGHISPNMLGPEPRIHVTQRKGVGVAEAQMVVIRAEGYPTGQKGMMPAWRVPFNR